MSVYVVREIGRPWNRSSLRQEAGYRRFIHAGSGYLLWGLMSYGTSWPDLFRRAAVYVDKILRGAKPAELPVEQPVRFELIINLEAAKQIGFTFPPSVLYRADEVIR